MSSRGKHSKFILARKSNNHKLKKIVILIGIVCLLTVFGIFTPTILKSQKLEVSLKGVNCTAEKEIMDTVQPLLLGKLFFDEQKILAQIQSRFPCVQRLMTERSLPLNLKLHFFGREAVFALQPSLLKEASVSAILADIVQDASKSAEATISATIQEPNNKYLLVDSTGAIFATTDKLVYLPTVLFWNSNLEVGDKVEGVLVKGLVKILDKFKVYNLPIFEVRIYPQSTTIVTSTSTIIFDLNKDISYELAALQLILDKAKIDEEKMEFIDLRFDKPIVKYAPRKK